VLQVAGNKTIVARYVVILYRLIYVYNSMVVVHEVCVLPGALQLRLIAFSVSCVRFRGCRERLANKDFLGAALAGAVVGMRQSSRATAHRVNYTGGRPSTERSVNVPRPRWSGRRQWRGPPGAGKILDRRAD